MELTSRAWSPADRNASSGTATAASPEGAMMVPAEPSIPSIAKVSASVVGVCIP